MTKERKRCFACVLFVVVCDCGNVIAAQWTESKVHRVVFNCRAMDGEIMYTGRCLGRSVRALASISSASGVPGVTFFWPA